MRQLVYHVSYTKYHVSFYFWLIGSALKHRKVPKHYDQDCRLNGVYCRDNLPDKIKDEVYVMNLEYSDIGTHWIALFTLNNSVTCFDSFGVEHIAKEIKT